MARRRSVPVPVEQLEQLIVQLLDHQGRALFTRAVELTAEAARHAADVQLAEQLRAARQRRAVPVARVVGWRRWWWALFGRSPRLLPALAHAADHEAERQQ